MTKSTIDPRSKKVLDFLKLIAVHNDRDWFHAHRSIYDDAAEAFSSIVSELISRISEFEPEISSLRPSDCTYRIYRDIRFTNDKSPYKIHMGAFVNARGKKSQHGGYYIHMQPERCLIGAGCYIYESKVLKAVRQSICDNIDEFRAIVEKPEFKRLFPTVGEEPLKTMPAGFPRDFEYPQYLRPRYYTVRMDFKDEDFLTSGWEEKVASAFKTAKPMIDFLNYTVDDYI